MVVMVYFAHTKHHSIRNIRSHVFTTFYGDGIIYFIVLTGQWHHSFPRLFRQDVDFTP